MNSIVRNLSFQVLFLYAQWRQGLRSSFMTNAGHGNFESAY